MSMRMIQLLSLSLLATAAAKTASPIQAATAVLDWIQKEGGMVHKFLEVGESGSPGNVGLFVKGGMIAKDEALLMIPQSCLLKYPGTNFDMCESGRELVGQLEMYRDKGIESSKHGIYMEYLDATKDVDLLPSGWSSRGKHSLLKLLTQDFKQVLAPRKMLDWSWQRDCMGDPEQESSYLLLLQRGWDGVMMPGFDMIRHRNGEWTNSGISSKTDGSVNVVVTATRDIQPDEELFTSYNLCGEECGNRADSYGTPEILRDQGTIEEYPQRFIIQEELAFEVKQVKGSERLSIEWLMDDGDMPTKEAVVFLEDQAARLESYAEEYLVERDARVPVTEFETIKKFHQVYLTAFSAAVDAAYDPDCNDDATQTTCSLGSRYNALTEQEDSLPYRDKKTCEFAKNLTFPTYSTFPDVDSPYHEISYYSDEDTRDSCFEIDNVVQICTSYRPHYHEMSVHYPARYLDKMERVLWVGGGDSMLLHEILKYPNLELVVGLELDQRVTRQTFKHFGAQPHFDNDKVQWWYGDAAKSLLLLPKEYFGTFDMVIVDLSETIMSLKVTDEVDIFGALSLLLNPNGIIIKNEIYFHDFTNLFDYTVQLYYYDVPIICSQSMVFGSYNTDYLLKEPIDHGVETVLNHMQDPARYSDWHDYQRNNAIPNPPCDEKANDTTNDTELEQDKSPGILMILEAEDVAPAAIVNAKMASYTLQVALNKAGLNTLGSEEVDQVNADFGFALVLLEEGYAVARLFKHLNYVAFDIHLWSSFGLMDVAKAAILEEFGCPGGKSSSSYRIVAGGMFGIDTWKEDQKNCGPGSAVHCHEEKEGDAVVVEPERTAPTDAAKVQTVLKESMAIIQAQDMMVAVICGKETEECKAVDTVKESGNVKTVVPIYTCPSMQDTNEYEKDALNKMKECQKIVMKQMQDATNKNGKFHAMVLDTNAVFGMGQIVVKIFESVRNVAALMQKDIAVLAVMDKKDDAWRLHVLERFRHDVIVDDPAYRARVLFNSTDSSLEMGITTSGDTEFVQHLTDAIAKIEEETSLVSDLRSLRGALFADQPEYNANGPTQFFHPSVYDQVTPYEQWKSQKPVAQQVVSQFEMAEFQSHLMVGDKVRIDVDDVIFYGTISGEEEDGKQFSIDYEDGDVEEDVPRNRLLKTESFYSEPDPLSAEQVQDAMQHALFAMKSQDTAKAELKEWDTPGKGLVLSAFWKTGNVVVLYDGDSHVDINLFTYEQEIEIANEFEQHFQKQIFLLARGLRDEQPRGIGRVVNFEEDIEVGHTPLWA
jgi:spermidine synthase